MPRHDRGNILFLILLAVVLFAALAYAVTSSMRGGGRDASQESLTAQASSILNYFAQMDAALLRMQMTGDMKIQNISLGNDKKMLGGVIVLNNQHNANCTTNVCRVFHPEGGGVSLMNFEKYAVQNPTSWTTSNTMPGWSDFIMMKWPDAGTEANDIVQVVQALRPTLCAEINKQMGITAIPGYDGTNWLSVTVPANWDNPGYTITPANAGQLVGKSTFGGGTNWAGTPGAYCHIFHLLIAR